MFQVGHYYRHISTMDIDIKVLHVLSWDEETEIGLKIRYVNRHNGALYWRHTPGDMDEYVFIKKSEFPKWKEVERVQK